VLTLRLLTVALGHHPVLNSTWIDTVDGPRIHVHPTVHLGIGVAAPRGLLCPSFPMRRPRPPANSPPRVNRLVADARAARSNHGAAGSTLRCPTSGRSASTRRSRVNHPEAAILGIGSLNRVRWSSTARGRPPHDDADVRFDHRVADGAQAAAFLGELRI